jgi:hypothetical protein
MGKIEPDHGYALEPRYWNLVRLTLTEVFGIGQRKAARLVDEYVLLQSEAPPDERLLGFHEEPLYVAADLIQRQKIEAHEDAAYGRIAKNAGWYPPTMVPQVEAHP